MNNSLILNNTSIEDNISHLLASHKQLVINQLPKQLRGLLERLFYTPDSSCVNACSLANAITATSCNKAGGVQYVFFTRAANINLSATSAQYNTVTGELTGFTMNAGQTFFVIKPNSLTDPARDTQTRTGGQNYSIGINFNFIGRDCTIANALYNLNSCCDLVVITVGYDCKILIYGLEWNGTALVPTNTINLTEHLIDSGQLNQESLQTGGFTGTQRKPAICFKPTIPTNSIPTNPVNP